MNIRESIETIRLVEGYDDRVEAVANEVMKVSGDVIKGQVSTEIKTVANRFRTPELYASPKAWRDFVNDVRMQLKAKGFKLKRAASSRVPVGKKVLSKQDKFKLAMFIYDEVGNSFPDGDPIDNIFPGVKRFLAKSNYNIEPYEAIDQVMRAEGHKDFNDYMATLWDQNAPDLNLEGPNPWKVMESTIKESVEKLNISSKDLVTRGRKVAEKIAAQFRKHERNSKTSPSGPNTSKFISTAYGMIKAGPVSVPAGHGSMLTHSYPVFIKIGTNVDPNTRADIEEQFLGLLFDLFLVELRPEHIYITTDNKKFKVDSVSGSAWGGFGLLDLSVEKYLESVENLEEAKRVKGKSFAFSSNFSQLEFILTPKRDVYMVNIERRDSEPTLIMSNVDSKISLGELFDIIEKKVPERLRPLTKNY